MSKLSVGESVYASTILSIEVKLKSLCPCIYKFVHFELATYLQHSFCHEPWTVCEGGAEKESSTIERPTVGFTAEENRASFFLLSFKFWIFDRLSRKSKKTREAVEARAEAKAKTIAFFRSNFSLRECLQWVILFVVRGAFHKKGHKAIDTFCTPLPL